jgi:hypothetical protein
MKDLNKLIKKNINEYVLLKESQEKTLDELLGLLSEYNLPDGDYAIFGSAPLMILGIIDSVNDLDVIIRPSKWSFKSKGEYRTDEIEFFDNWPGFDVDDLIDNHTFEHKGFLFVNPNEVIKYKRNLKRDKDKNIWGNKFDNN